MTTEYKAPSEWLEALQIGVINARDMGRIEAKLLDGKYSPDFAAYYCAFHTMETLTDEYAEEYRRANHAASISGIMTNGDVWSQGIKKLEAAYLEGYRSAVAQ
jgi:hypothetical protein